MHCVSKKLRPLYTLLTINSATFRLHGMVTLTAIYFAQTLQVSTNFSCCLWDISVYAVNMNVARRLTHVWFTV